MNKLTFVKALWSPFKPFKLKWYCGKIAIGTPYFYPRRWINNIPVPKKIGFDFVGLGWKTKWTCTDYRFEWSPRISFVFFGYQIAVIVNALHDSSYWESWLYYERNTDKSKSKKERIEQCKLEFPQTWTTYNKDTKQLIDYYKLILKNKYLWTQ
jgi:hypothetical protein